MEISNPGVLSNNTAQVYAIQHPLSIIFNSTSPQDWYSNMGIHNNSLWPTDQKGLFDPCPTGWKVPSNVTWDDMTTSDNLLYYTQGVQQESLNDYYATNGRVYNQLTWLPLSGCRPSITGKIAECGRTSYYWTNTASAENATYFALTYRIASLGDSGHRGGGLSIRCVQE